MQFLISRGLSHPYSNHGGKHLWNLFVISQGVPVQGYCFWTTSDNWEWADGYGPKFGLVAVDRENNLKRVPRPSYYLFSEVKHWKLQGSFT